MKFNISSCLIAVAAFAAGIAVDRVVFSPVEDTAAAEGVRVRNKESSSLSSRGSRSRAISSQPDRSDSVFTQIKAGKVASPPEPEAGPEPELKTEQSETEQSNSRAASNTDKNRTLIYVTAAGVVLTLAGLVLVRKLKR